MITIQCLLNVCEYGALDPYDVAKTAPPPRSDLLTSVALHLQQYSNIDDTRFLGCAALSVKHTQPPNNPAQSTTLFLPST